MKKAFWAIAPLCLAASPILAGGYVAPVADVPPILIRQTAAPAFTWSGPYVGGEVGRTRWDRSRTVTTTTPDTFRPITERQKIWRWTPPEERWGPCTGDGFCPVPEEGTGEWVDGNWTGDWQYDDVVVGTERVPGVTTTITEALSNDANSYGLFAGYRYQFGNNVVTGVEARYSKTDFADVAAVEGQLGYALGRALPYIAAGAAHADGGNGWQAAVGIDYAVTDSLFVGVRYTKQDFDDVSGWKAESDTVSVRVGIRF